jgi:hypothetical protein
MTRTTTAIKDSHLKGMLERLVANSGGLALSLLIVMDTAGACTLMILKRKELMEIFQVRPLPVLCPD